MPQINRIRVNNVKYNFGTQFYDDFVMRFSCRNSIYDLANGGGKSVLMLLLLQNLIPNCTLDDKQPIEKLFRTDNGSKTIHSLVEWKLDACDVFDGFKYMTTGFCARKGKDNGEEPDRAVETANIEYFNYCIFYKSFGDNDIKNLPLSNGSERITYNGLKEYLRNLEKKDLGVSVRIFDRKGDYQNFISQYGLYESQWEIVRGINKTEGHVRTYFENNYKTTRKVVEDLLIEEIIEKSYNNRIRKDTSDDTIMAQTLLDIKDQLIDLSKRRDEADNYDSQIKLLCEFADGLMGFSDIFDRKKDAQTELLECLFACRKLLESKRAMDEELNASLEKYERELNNVIKLSEALSIELEYEELDKLVALNEEVSRTRDELAKKLAELKNELRLMEVAGEYNDYLEYSKKYNEIKELLNSNYTDKDDALATLTLFANAKKKIVDRKVLLLQSKLDSLTQEQAGYESQNVEATENEKNLFAAVNVLDGQIKELKAVNNNSEAELANLLKNVNLIVADGVEEELANRNARIETCENNIKALEASISSCEKTADMLSQEILLAQIECEKLRTKKFEIEDKLAKYEITEQKIDKLKKIYGDLNNDSLLKTMEAIHENLMGEKIQVAREHKYLTDYYNNIKAHKLPEYEDKFQVVLDYLKNRYSDTIRSGKEYLETLSMEDARKTLGETPWVLYAIFAGKAYEQIASDKVLTSINTGSYIIPILQWPGENAEYFNDIIPVYKNASFVYDEAALAAECDKLSEELHILSDKLEKITDRCNVVWEDIIFIKDAIEKDIDSVKKELADVVASLFEAEKRVDELNDSAKKNDAKLVADAGTVKAERVLLDSLKGEVVRLKSIEEMASQREARTTRISNMSSEFLDKKNQYVQAKNALADLQMALSECKTKIASLSDELESVKNDFSTYFAMYVDESKTQELNYTEEEIDAKAGALRRSLEETNGDKKDKENLLATYDQSMKKCIQNIKYAGLSLEDVAALKNEGKLRSISLDEKLEQRNKITEVEKNITSTDSQIEAQSAQINRIEGSIEYAKKHFVEKFGDFERAHVDNPAAAVLRYKQEISEITKKKMDINARLKELENSNKDALIMEKDIERIMKNAGIEIPSEYILHETTDQVSVEIYEEIQTRYFAILKEEDRAKSDFIKKKLKLIDALNECNAFELANEIRNSAEVPSDRSMVDMLYKGLMDTNDCIVLERDRIEKSMRDMEVIKDSFEERCIQICSNIRTELDRLSKLSKITLDDEVISIITLNVPYIKEELYKDRMSVYINETVAVAENFATADEKLKYIKGRLSWKKMFSVIVTDMNSIKLSLYKREHIKDQSRYLRYEEAVGSTGQSQGIYIQFLIAIINYISSINALGKDTSAIGKTIFIDNPFGAAKDVYIWEPIFKMLATNHVQLIVPARGATPAITKMFDVNYILGQKMVAGKQQTVVVDYRSQVQTENTDYAQLDYEQSTFDFMQ